MKTDRELLELAAKVAGYSFWQSKHGYLNVTRPDGSTFTACHYWPKFDDRTGEKLPDPTLADAVADSWNPLDDDGDAFRLGVERDVFSSPRFSHERAVLMFTKNMPKLEATRRAIVLTVIAEATIHV